MRGCPLSDTKMYGHYIGLVMSLYRDVLYSLSEVVPKVFRNGLGLSVPTALLMNISVGKCVGCGVLVDLR